MVAIFIKEIERTRYGQQNLQQIPDKPAYHAKAAQLEQEYGLSFFDSLHAAVAIEEGYTMISADSKYKGIKGLRSINPRNL